MAKNPPLEDEKKLDLSFKEGQTIKINLGVTRLFILRKFLSYKILSVFGTIRIGY